jgi:hypothetical protein
MLAKRGIDVTYETIRQWSMKFGTQYAHRLKDRQDRLGDRWHHYFREARMQKQISKRLTAVAAAMLLVTGCLAATTVEQNAETERIAIPTLKEKLESGDAFLLIDVREDWELEESGAIAGAIHIPMGELEARMPDIPKDIELVFY